VACVKDQFPADTLPTLYRLILDDVWALERAGSRQAAGRLRLAATRAYSRAWDEKAVRQLEDIGRRARRQCIATEDTRPRPRWSRVRVRFGTARESMPRPTAAPSQSTSPGLG
jgi:hypothetical protein